MAEGTDNTIGTDANTVIAPPTTPTGEKIARIVVPIGMLLIAIVVWQIYVVASGTPKYILPTPVDVGATLLTDWPTLLPSLWVTLSITFQALILALIGGVGLAIILVQSKWIELALFPFAVILQVTPIVAIAPLLLIYAPNTQTALLIVPRGVFPDPFQHGAGAEERRPQPAQPVRPLRRRPLAAADPP